MEWDPLAKWEQTRLLESWGMRNPNPKRNLFSAVNTTDAGTQLAFHCAHGAFTMCPSPPPCLCGRNGIWMMASIQCGAVHSRADKLTIHLRLDLSSWLYKEVSYTNWSSLSIFGSITVCEPAISHGDGYLSCECLDLQPGDSQNITVCWFSWAIAWLYEVRSACLEFVSHLDLGCVHSLHSVCDKALHALLILCCEFLLA